jgi:hypothetical protein
VCSEACRIGDIRGEWDFRCKDAAWSWRYDAERNDLQQRPYEVVADAAPLIG